MEMPNGKYLMENPYMFQSEFSVNRVHATPSSCGLDHAGRDDSERIFGPLLAGYATTWADRAAK